MWTTKRMWMAAITVAGCVACGGAADGVGTDDAAEDRAHADSPQRQVGAAPVTPGPECSPKAAPGYLDEGSSPSARTQICVAFDAEARVTAIDEHECTRVTASHLCDSCDEYAYCGGCLLYLTRATDQPWTLAARPGNGCEIFGGSYTLLAPGLQ
jgi:hypothetical protein